MNCKEYIELRGVEQNRFLVEVLIAMQENSECFKLGEKIREIYANDPNKSILYAEMPEDERTRQNIIADILQPIEKGGINY